MRFIIPVLAVLTLLITPIIAPYVAQPFFAVFEPVFLVAEVMFFVLPVLLVALLFCHPIAVLVVFFVIGLLFEDRRSVQD